MADPTPIPPAPTPAPIIIPPVWRAWAMPAVLLAGAFVAGMFAHFHFGPSVDPTPPEPDMSSVITVKAPTSAMTTIKLPSGLSPDALQWMQPPTQAAKIQLLTYADHVVVCPQTDGVYDLAATSFTGGKFTLTTWRITAGKGPIPPPPGPDPVPPVPVPPPPSPTPSALQKSLEAAYYAETDPKKSANTTALGDLFANVVAAAKASGKVKTHKDMQTAVKTATDLAIGPTAIPEVRKAVGAYLVTVLPTTPSVAADENYWAKAASEYGYVAIELGKIRR